MLSVVIAVLILAGVVFYFGLVSFRSGLIELSDERKENL